MAYVNEEVGQSSRRSAGYEDWLDSRFDAKSLVGELSAYLPAPASRPQEVERVMLPPSCLRSEMYGDEYFRAPAELHVGGFKSEVAVRRARADASVLGSRVLKLGRVAPEVSYEEVVGWYERELSYCDAQSVDLLDGNVYLCFESEEDAQLVYEYLRTEIVVFSTRRADAMFGSDDEEDGALSILGVSLCFNPQEIAVAVANKILLVTVNEVVNPVTMSMLVRLFSLYGAIEKIITFTKSGTNTYQALIQYGTKTEARDALLSLEGKMLYANSNRLEIVYSKLSELNIQHNNTKAWDFTVQQQSNNGTVGANMLSAGYSDILGMPKLPKEIKEWKNNVPVMTNGGSVLIVYHLSTQNIDDIFNIFSLYGVVTRIKILREKPDTALVQFSDCVYASLARYFLNLIALWTEPIQIGLSKITEVKMPSGGASVDDDCLKSKAYSQSDQRFCEPVKFAKSACFPTNTIFIASIADETPHKRIIDLVSSIGPVNEYEIRLPYPGGPKKTHMLVEYPSADLAIRAIATLHNQELNGSQIKIAFSKVRLTKKKK
ncbi:putative polypyrimidine tract-binding protein [Gregarina niphandrodes]|uniref:Polypyrimidine tract-binding protein n=1 Tax=Gregarina niphandrodes TaxID=110365 RepID=A0A023B4M7_GRENI|nr:putative polypyrimidine tract-binding protein [Gregarina niphandrodes]EZG57134.1 putative polypyrimidine tract-binding protein [Gregarina niphandrodes]|eukprot:XP_011131093.1 putative polypyrimidine tract-binding protein [Gregarina niphandrodes]